MKLLRECIRALLTEDPMGFVHDLAAASEDFGEDFSVEILVRAVEKLSSVPLAQMQIINFFLP